MSRKEKLAKLQSRIERAEVALASDEIPALQGANGALLDAIVEAPANAFELVKRGNELRRGLLAKISTLEVAALARSLVACPCCRGTELLVAERCSIDAFYVGTGSAPLEFSLIVCKSCGDMRMRCDDLGKLEGTTNSMDRKCFHPITLAEVARGPFR